jgi:hypothetical protein
MLFMVAVRVRGDGVREGVLSWVLLQAAHVSLTPTQQRTAYGNKM